MKKLSLLFLSVASLVFVLISVAFLKKRVVVDYSTSDTTISLVWQKLSHFTKKHPLEIDYIQDPVLNTGPAEWSSDYLKKFLAKTYFIFRSKKIMSHLTFGSEHLQPGAAVTVQVIYQPDANSSYGKSIYILENLNLKLI